jgi:aromatic-L-amino-acid decarboxylase
MSKNEISLDPENWEKFRKLGHKAIDDMVDHLKDLPNQPAWQEMPEKIKNSFNSSIPLKGESEEDAYQEFVEKILPYPSGNSHPRFSGWVQGNGTPLGMLSDMLASGMNPHMAGFNQAPKLVEEQALKWMAEMMGMPDDTSGLFASGGTMANIMGLAVARHAKADFDVRTEGLQEIEEKLVIYCSSQTHSWAKRACEFLGFGNKWLRVVAVNKKFQMNLEELQERIEADKKAGLKPICVIATAGTVNTGAIDDLNAIADICKKHDLWFHIDGAFGALVKISKVHKHLVNGLERCDSLAFDLHKWMYLPFEIACILVRDAKMHKACFDFSASYLAKAERGAIAGGLPFAERGIELTRGFKALKVWMSLKAYGLEKFSKLIEQNIEQIRYLKDLIDASVKLERVADVPLNVLCFRYIDSFLGEQELNELNEEILLQLQEKGIALPSSTIIDGKFAIRVANVNHRAKFSDFELLAESVERLGDEILQAI